MIRTQLNKTAASLLTGAVLSVGAMFTLSASEAAPCSCWDGGGVRCKKPGDTDCSNCWAGWDNISATSGGTGIDAMEQCRKACEGVNSKNNLNQKVWWYADETALNSCKEYAKDLNKDIINKYEHE